MRIIGVIDLLGGLAVHARAGRRERYRPVRAVAGTPIESGDPQQLARGYIDRLGLSELYVADLDAILSRASQDRVVGGIARLGTPLWLDAGVSTVAGARLALSLGAARIVVGLETLPSYAALDDICRAVGGERVAFSLDLRHGEPVVMNDAVAPGQAAPEMAARAVDAGAGAVIVLDLALVGTRTGPDVRLIAAVRAATRGVTLVAGGGVRDLEDLERLGQAGCDAALVATALHDGVLDAAAVAAARRHRSDSR